MFKKVTRVQPLGNYSAVSTKGEHVYPLPQEFIFLCLYPTEMHVNIQAEKQVRECLQQNCSQKSKTETTPKSVKWKRQIMVHSNAQCNPMQQRESYDQHNRMDESACSVEHRSQTQINTQYTIPFTWYTKYAKIIYAISYLHRGLHSNQKAVLGRFLGAANFLFWDLSASYTEMFSL